MPNIQMYGKHPEGLKERIELIMQKMGLGGDAITTDMASEPESCDGERRPMPFIRICASKVSDIDRIVEEFKSAGLEIDTETLLLNSFIPADKMK